MTLKLIMTRTVAHLVFYLTLLFAITGIQPEARAQSYPFLPLNQPEQDACGALIICSDTFSTAASYKGTGQVPEYGEDYAHWLKVTIASPGDLIFKIIPRLTTDEYNFYVFNGSGKACSALSGSDAIRSNNSTPALYNHGVTGLSLVSPFENTNLTQFSKKVEAHAGDIYYILINNYGPPIPGTAPFTQYYATAGYKIDFTGSTCTFVTGPSPRFDSVALKCTNYKEIEVHLSRKIRCSSVEQFATDFEIRAASGTTIGAVYDATPLDCTLNKLTDRVKITFAPNCPAGRYILKAKKGTDGNTLIDMCDVELPLPDEIPFIVPDLDSVVSLKVCPQQMPYTWNGITINTPGNNVASFVSPTWFGCDSMATLNLTVTDTMRATVNLTICASLLPYTWHGITVPAPGNNVATYITPASGGCDSAVTLNLSLLNPLAQTLELSSCGPLTFNGHTYTASQVVHDTVKSYQGCDSLYRTLNIAIHPDLIPQSLTRDTAGCGHLLYNDQVYVENIQLKDTLYNQYGCDSIYLTTNITIYPGIRPGKITQTVSDCSSVVFEGVTYTRDTTFVSMLTNRIGCDSIERTVKVVIRELGLVLKSDPEDPVKGDYVTLTTSADVPYSILAWQPAGMFPDQTAKGQHFIIREDGIFKVTGVSENGCIDTAELKLKADSLIPAAVMPNAFSPNGDGLNDEFRPMFVSKSGYLVKRFFIYNRWGREVYHAFNLKEAAWNGLYGNTGKPADMGTYYYVIEIEFIDKTKATFKGEIALIR